MGCGFSTATAAAPAPVQTDFQKRMAALATPSDSGDRPTEPDVQQAKSSFGVGSFRAVETDELEMQQATFNESFEV